MMTAAERFVLVLVLFLAVLVLLPTDALAAEDISRVESAIPDSARELAGELSGSDAADPASALNRIFNSELEKIKGVFADGVRNGASVLVVVMLCSLAQGFSQNSPALTKAITVGGAAAVTTVFTGRVTSVLGGAAELVEELHTFSKVLLPTLAAAAAGSGQITSSAAKLAASTLFMDLLISLGRGVVLPLIYAYIAASTANAAFGGLAKGAVKLIKWDVNSLLILISTAFTVYLSMAGIITSAADAAAVKVTKTAIANLLPLVGKMVSDAADAVTSGFTVLRGTVGVLGMLAVAAVFLLPAMRLGVNALVFKACAALSEAFSAEPLSGLVADMGTALTMALALAGTCTVILFISIIAAVGVVA